MLSNALTKDESRLTYQTNTQNYSAVLSGKKKPWKDAILSKLSELTKLPFNWDSYGANSVSADKAALAYSLLNTLMRENTPLPVIVPTPSGSVQIEWHENNIDLEIEIISATQFDVSYEDLTNPTEEWEGIIGLDLAKLDEYVKELTNRTPLRIV